jgi:hypothetical protein
VPPFGATMGPIIERGLLAVKQFGSEYV